MFLETWFHVNMESYISSIEWICFVFWQRRNVNCNYFQFIVYPFLFLLFWWYMSKIAGQGNYSLQIIFDLCRLSKDNAINTLESRFYLSLIDDILISIWILYILIFSHKFLNAFFVIIYLLSIMLIIKFEIMKWCRYQIWI